MPFTTPTAGTVITVAYATANIRDQVVTPFASTGARDSAIASPVTGMLEYISSNDVNEGLTSRNSASQWRKPWNMPWGLLGFGQLTATSTAAGATVIDVTSATITLTTVARRYLRVVGYARVQQSTSSATNEMYITDGSNNIKQTSSFTLAASDYAVHHQEVILTSAGASETFKLRHAATAGTTNALGSSTQPVFIAVYDVGPQGAPA